MLTFHDWIIATGNRLQLLDTALSLIEHRGLETTTVAGAWRELTQVALGTEPDKAVPAVAQPV